MMFKPKSSSRSFIQYTCLACLFFGGVSIANAQTVESIMHKNEIDPNSGAAIVLFKADSDPSYWLEKVKKTMRAQDDLAVFNPYWITAFTDEAVSSGSGCGVVVGTWYTRNYIAKDRWEAILENGLQRLRYTILYVSDGGKLVSGDPVNGNRLWSDCK